MGRYKNKAHKDQMEKLKEYLFTETTWDLMKDSMCADPTQGPGLRLMNDIGGIHDKILTLDDVVRHALEFGKAANGYSLRMATQKLQENIKVHKAEERALGGQSSHRDKRMLVRELGLQPGGRPFSINDILARVDSPLPSDPKIIFRDRSASPVKLGTSMRDSFSKKYKKHAVVNEDSNFYIVEPGESVIFISKQDTGQLQIELVVIRGVAQGGKHSKLLYDWLSGVTFAAVHERRNVRPSHNGEMIQLGWNAGPRHCVVSGLAKSFTRSLNLQTYISRDQDAIALVTIFWSLARAVMPVEIISIIDKCLADNNLPEISGRYAEHESGYRMFIRGKNYYFPQFPRGTPEAYLTSDYCAPAHIDNAFATWALSWCNTRIDKKEVPEPVYQTRSQSEPSDDPPGGGGHFVDLTLKVIVKQSTGTMMAFQPGFPHGTTHLCGAHNQVATITFSRHIWEAYLDAQQGPTLRAGEGTGHENRIYTE